MSVMALRKNVILRKPRSGCLEGRMGRGNRRAMLDLILKGGRVIDPASGRDEVADIGFADGKVAAIGSDLPLRGAEIVDARGPIVAPGLIYLHPHVYCGATPPRSHAPHLAPQRRT